MSCLWMTHITKKPKTLHPELNKQISEVKEDTKNTKISPVFYTLTQLSEKEELQEMQIVAWNMAS